MHHNEVSSSSLGVIAGGGALVRDVCDAAILQGRRVHVIRIEGESSGDLEGFPGLTLTWGKLGRMFGYFKEHNISEVLLIGAIKARPDLKALIPDFSAMNLLPLIRSLAQGGDASVLNKVSTFLEGKGLRVRGVKEIVPEWVVTEGRLCGEASPEAESDARLGFELLRVMGPYDVGQALVVMRGRVVAVEAAEGTDAMLDRVASLRASGHLKAGAREGVLVKAAKPEQDLRLDMPVVGAQTMIKAAAAGLQGVVLQAEGVLLANRQKTLESAQESQLFCLGYQAIEQNGKNQNV